MRPIDFLVDTVKLPFSVVSDLSKSIQGERPTSIKDNVDDMWEDIF
jgi:hypothetical protein